MTIQLDAKAPYAAQGTFSLKAQRLETKSEQNLTYTDENGRAFNLSLKESVSISHITYDRSARFKGPQNLKGDEASENSRAETLKALGLDFDQLFRDTVERITKLLQGQTFRHFPGRMQPPPPMMDGSLNLETEHLEIVQISQSVTIDMNEVDTDYWSVENTAGRLVDFAKSLYAGGDRQAHLEKMMEGIDQGFSEAKAAFGGFLPDISTRTVELAKTELAEWARQGEAAPPPEELLVYG